MITYPLNNVLYQAEDAELFNCSRSSGVFAGSDFSCLVTGADNNITIQEGLGWIRNSRFSGKVVALKTAEVLELGVADSLHPRIDAVVIRYDSTQNKTELIIKQGNPSANPAPPEVTQTEAVYELHLYHVRREVGSLTITSANVTDVRLNPQYCGLMADSVTKIDTSAIWAQIEALIKNADEHINDAIETHLQEAKDGGEFDGVSIISVEQTKTSDEDGGENEITVLLSNTEKSTFVVKNGEKGGRGDRGDPGTTNFNTLVNKPVAETWTFAVKKEDGSIETVTKEIYMENPIKNVRMFRGGGDSHYAGGCATISYNNKTYSQNDSFYVNKGDQIKIIMSAITGHTITVNGVVVQESSAYGTQLYTYTVTDDVIFEHAYIDDHAYITIISV